MQAWKWPKRGGAHLESPPPSAWKASGLEPSFMNFMATRRRTDELLSASLNLSLSPRRQLLCGSACASCFHLTPPCLLPPHSLLLRRRFLTCFIYSGSRGRSPEKRTHTGVGREGEGERWSGWFGEGRGGGIKLGAFTAGCMPRSAT